MDPYSLHTSLLSTTITTTTTNSATTNTTAANSAATTTASLSPKHVPSKTITNISTITSRLIFISFIGIIAIWANQEASKGFSIKIINDAGKHSYPGKRFSVFYESNDKATRIVVKTSKFVENLLYPNQDFIHTKKQINSVTLTLASTNFPANVSVDTRKPHEYVVTLSPSLMEASNSDEVVVSAVLQGMARVWLWDGQGAAPPMLLNGIVEYISSLAGFIAKPADLADFAMKPVWNSGDKLKMSPESNEICWKDEDPRKVAGFLRYCDQREQVGGGGNGGSAGGEVVRRLNEGMRNGWDKWIVDDVLGSMGGGHNVCGNYNMMMRSHNPSSSK